MKKSILATSLLAITLAAPIVSAHQAGDFIIRAGAITVNPHEHSSSVKIDRGALVGNSIGGKVTMDSDTQLGLNFAYMITDQIGIELLGATPFNHNVKVKGTSLAAVDPSIANVANGRLGKITHLPPTLSLVYYPADPKQAFQPYVGIGLNYTWIYNEKLSNSAKHGTAQYSNFKVRNSWGWAAQIGADYMITDKVMLNAQIRYIDIDTRASVSVNGLYNAGLAPAPSRAKVDLSVNPWVYMVGIGYKF